MRNKSLANSRSIPSARKVQLHFATFASESSIFQVSRGLPNMMTACPVKQCCRFAVGRRNSSAPEKCSKNLGELHPLLTHRHRTLRHFTRPRAPSHARQSAIRDACRLIQMHAKLIANMTVKEHMHPYLVKISRAKGGRLYCAGVNGRVSKSPSSQVLIHDTLQITNQKVSTCEGPGPM